MIIKEECVFESECVCCVCVRTEDDRPTDDWAHQPMPTYATLINVFPTIPATRFRELCPPLITCYPDFFCAESVATFRQEISTGRIFFLLGILNCNRHRRLRTEEEFPFELPSPHWKQNYEKEVIGDAFTPSITITAETNSDRLVNYFSHE